MGWQDREDTRTYRCLRCMDSGMETGLRCEARGHWCESCRLRDHQMYEHTFARRCSCRQSNPVYLAYVKRLQDATVAQTRAKREGA